MHLTGQSYARDIVASEVGTGERFANRDATGAPPIFGMLFGPTDLRRSEGGVFFCSGREQMALLIDDEGACAASSYVNAYEFNGLVSVWWYLRRKHLIAKFAKKGRRGRKENQEQNQCKENQRNFCEKLRALWFHFQLCS